MNGSVYLLSEDFERAPELIGPFDDAAQAQAFALRNGIAPWQLLDTASATDPHSSAFDHSEPV